MQRFRLALASFCVVTFCIGEFTFGQCPLPRRQHAWGSFRVGSWKTVRVLYENLDSRGNVVSTSSKETTTTLVALDNETYTLRIEVALEVAGKKFDSEPQTMTYRFDGEDDGAVTEMKKIGTHELEIDERRIPCEVHEIVTNIGDTKRKSTVYYSEDVAPHVLRRETVTIGSNGESGEHSSLVEVVAVSMPHEFDSSLKTVSQIKTVHRGPKGTTVTREFHSPDVPGGVVYHSSSELDESGATVRRSTLSLLDYDLGDGDPVAKRQGIFARRRDRRSPRQP